MYTILNGFASGVGSVGTGAHHIAFSVFIFFAVFGDAVSMVSSPATPMPVQTRTTCPQFPAPALCSPAAVKLPFPPGDGGARSCAVLFG